MLFMAEANERKNAPPSDLDEESQEVAARRRIVGMTCKKIIERVSKICEQVHAAGVLIVWDGGRWSQRRLDLLPEYKQNRITPSASEEANKEKAFHKANFKRVVSDISSYFPVFSIPSFMIPHKEADDVIAWICRNYSKHSDFDHVYVVSDDSDFKQLISDDVSVVLFQEQNILHKDSPLPEGSIPLEQYLLFKACLGDSSDNISHIAGVGETTLQDVFRGFTRTTPGALFVHLMRLANRDKVSPRILAMIDNFHIVLRNLQLIDLSLEEFDEMHVQILQSCFERSLSSTFSEEKALGFLKMYDIYSLSDPNTFDVWSFPLKKLGEAGGWTGV
jgi:hypothetical protein